MMQRILVSRAELERIHLMFSSINLRKVARLTVTSVAAGATVAIVLDRKSVV